MEKDQPSESNDPTKNRSVPAQTPAADWDKIERIFGEACELAAEAREAFLDRECANDPSLRAQVALLIQSDAAAGNFMAGSAQRRWVDLEHGNVSGGATGEGTGPRVVMALPEKIGRYELLEVIGEGGFGTVYKAQQHEPIHRTVAVKIIKPGMDTRAVIARFEAERQALAMMDHQNIARVFDAGETLNGRPYFVMELVDGVPITQYCDRHMLNARQRLELFIPVCQAVQHAHQKAIIHRDLKPTNVLVAVLDGKPVPKVIDFGIAKATDARLTEKTFFTEQRQMIGTPQYMSPEQADSGGIDIDTRSDIYSLGVMLYELLTGTTPLDAKDLRRQAFAEIQRIICEVEPPPPSSRISMLAGTESSVAAQRSTEFRQLKRTLSGELDWVVMKCLQKERGRRYDSAAGLAADLSRYLLHEPVSAARPSKIYQAQKYIRRHRVAVTAGSMVAISLVAGAALSTVGFVRAKGQQAIAQAQRAEADRQRAQAQIQQKRAEKEAAIARAVNEFVRQMLATASPRKSLGDKVTVLQAVDAAATALDRGSLADQPLVEAAVRETLGETLEGLGQFGPAEHQFQVALNLERQFAESPDDPELAVLSSDMGSIYAAQGRLSEAQSLLSTTLAIDRKILPVDHPELINAQTNLALVVEQLGDFKQAEMLLKETLAKKRKTTAPGDPSLAQQINNLADCYSNEGNLTDAEPLFREALAVQRAALPAGHPDLAIVLDNLGTLLEREGHPSDAEPLHREALEISRRALPAGHPDIASHLYALARTLEAEGKFTQADPLYREAADICRAAWPEGNTHVALILEAWSKMLMAQGKAKDAQPPAAEALEIYRKLLAPGHRDIVAAEKHLSDVLKAENKRASTVP